MKRPLSLFTPTDAYRKAIRNDVSNIEQDLTVRVVEGEINDLTYHDRMQSQEKKQRWKCLFFWRR